jgi:drug/metabolite transporter (DMT)-like permease
MDWLSVYSKLLSESLLSLYPIFVKKISLPIDIQLWVRLITYVLVSLFFINYSWVVGNIFSTESIVLSFVNVLHIYSSYEGFMNLDSGVAFSIFNIYPLLILLFSGVTWKIEYFYSIVGLIFFIISKVFYDHNDISKMTVFSYGFIMIIIAAITEAMIYFIVKNIKTDNNWNHLFIAYFFGAIITSLYVFKNYYMETFETTNTENISLSTENISLSKENTNSNTNSLSLIGLALLINGVIGAIGYWLRFYSVYRLEPGIYSVLSYFGIIMAYIYGILFNGETLDWAKILGTFFIILSNYLVI